MELLFKHTWVLFIAITVINGLVVKYRSGKYIAENPALKEGYEHYFIGWLFYGNIPWIIMAIGVLSGYTNSTFDYLNPETLNPTVLLFHASIVVLWILAIWWIYFRNGAAFIARHPGIFRKTSFSGNTNATAKQVKLFVPLMILGGIAGMLMMWMTKIPVP